jgi:exosortase
MLVERRELSDPQDEARDQVAANPIQPPESVSPKGWIDWFRSWTNWDWFCLGLPLLALSPLLAVGARMLWHKQHMQFFPIAIAAVVWFVASEGVSKKPTRLRISLARTGAWLTVFLVVVASVIHSSWLAHITLVAALFFWMLGKFGDLSMTRIYGISGLALITVPFPFNGDQELVRVLQRISSFACSRMMDALGIMHVRMGNVLELVDKQLLVEEACSGVDSQYALMAVAGVLLLVGRASLWVSVITIATVPVWAVLGNILRIFSIVIGVQYFGIDLSTGWQHTLLGLFAFAMAAWAHWSSVQFLNWLEWMISPPKEHRVREFEGLKGVKCNDGPTVSKLGMTLACALLVFLPLSSFLIGSTYFRTTVPILKEDFIASLPGERSNMPYFLASNDIAFETKRRYEGHQEGQCSRAWRVSRMSGAQMLSIDLPFRGGHPLWVCYSGTGWTLTTERTIDLFSKKLESNWPIQEIIMRGPEGQWAILHFVHADVFGKPFDNNATRLVDSVTDPDPAHRTRWSNEFFRVLRERFLVFPSKRKGLPLTVQFQLLTQGAEVPSADEIEETRKQFQACREQFLIEMQPAFERMQREFD